MLIGNRAAFIGVIFGVFLATLLISQQSAIFLGLLSRSYRIVTDISEPNLWIMDQATESDDKVRSIDLGYVDTIRSIPGIEWAVPLQQTRLPLVTKNGTFQIGQIFGIDEATLIGAPKHMITGQVRDLRRSGSVIIDVYSANGILAHILPDGTKEPLKIGDELEINNRHAVIVGISEVTQGFYPQPIIFTSSGTLQSFTGIADQTSFIAAYTAPGINPDTISENIRAQTDLNAVTRDHFKEKIVLSFLKTGILINFGLSVVLGIIIGFSIAGQSHVLRLDQSYRRYQMVNLSDDSHTNVSRRIFRICIRNRNNTLVGYCSTRNNISILVSLAITRIHRHISATDLHIHC
jgi:putative ABC transport system permease protein